MYLLVAVLSFNLLKLQVAVTEDEIPVLVARRLNGDLYMNYNSSDHYTCHDDNLTFLVSERICVKDQELIDGICHLIMDTE